MISYKEYIQIIKSPQIDHIKYENQGFSIWTNDGYYFKLRLRREQ